MKVIESGRCRRYDSAVSQGFDRADYHIEQGEDGKFRLVIGANHHDPEGYVGCWYTRIEDAKPQYPSKA